MVAHLYWTGNDVNLTLDSKLGVGGGMEFVLGVGAGFFTAMAVLLLKRWLARFRKHELTRSTSGDEIELSQGRVKQ